MHQPSDRGPLRILALTPANQGKLLLADPHNFCVKEYDLASQTTRIVYQTKWNVFNLKKICPNICKESRETMATLERDELIIPEDHDHSEPEIPSTRVCICKKTNDIFKCEQVIALEEHTTDYLSSLEQLSNGNILAGFVKLYEIALNSKGKFSLLRSCNLPKNIRSLALSKKDHAFIAYTDNTLIEYEIKLDNFLEIHKFVNITFPDFLIYDNKNEALIYQDYKTHQFQAISLKEGAAKNPFEIGPVKIGPEATKNIELACWAFIEEERIAFVSRDTWEIFFLRQIYD